MYIPKLEVDFKSWLGIVVTHNGGFYQTIETSTKSGVPDVYLVFETRYTWLELKVGYLDAPLARKEQRVWGLKHAQRGGRSFFLYCNKNTCQLMLYKNPVVEVKKYGKYLMIMDPPIDTAESSVLGVLTLLRRNLV